MIKFKSIKKSNRQTRQGAKFGARFQSRTGFSALDLYERFDGRKGMRRRALR